MRQFLIANGCGPACKAPARALTAALLLGVTACGPLVQIGGNDKAPTALMTLRATAAPLASPAAAYDRSRAVLVQIPAATGALQTLRVPVITSDTQLAYLTGATWAEQPNRQLQRVLSDTLEANGVATLDPRAAPLPPTRSLDGTLVECSLDVRDAAHAVVRVRYDAALATNSKGPVALRRFDASEPVVSQSPADVAVALNTAANRLAGDVAGWVKVN